MVVVIVIMGTFTIAILVEDIDEAEALFEKSNQFVEKSLQVVFDDLAKIPDIKHRSFFNKVNSSLDITIGYLNRHTKIFDKGKLDNNYDLKNSLNIIPEHFYGNYFIVNNAGDVVLDETGYLEGNLLEIVDDSGNRLFESDTKMEDLRDNNFSSSWLKDQEKTVFYAFLKKLNDNYNIGLMTSREEAIETYKKMYFEHLNDISNLESATYVVYNLRGDRLLGGFELTESVVEDYIKESSLGKLSHVEHEEFGILHYQVFLELDWLVIHQDRQLNQLRYLTKREGKARTKQLIWMFYLIFTLLVVIFVCFTVVSKTVKNKLNTQINSLNDSFLNGKLILDDDILFDEFGKVAQLFNKMIQKMTPMPSRIEKPIQNDSNKGFLIKTIKSHLVDAYEGNASESFELKELMSSSLEKMNVETSGFDIDIICDQEIIMFQNKVFLTGLIRFFVTNYVVNSGYLSTNTITIEIFADDSEVNISFTRNIIKKYESHADVVLNIFEELDEEIMSTLNGRLDYSNYVQADKKLVIHCPLVN